MNTPKTKRQCRALGMRIHELRKMKGLTLRELSNLTTLDNSKIAKMEKGMINVTFTSLMEICNGLGMHPREFMDFEVG